MASSSKHSMVDSTAASAPTLKRHSDDMDWEFGVLYDPDDLQRVKCKLCGKEMGGGISRLKQHAGQVKGQVKSCMVANKDQQKRCKDACDAAALKKKAKILQEEEVRAQVNLDIVHVEDNDDEEGLDLVGKGGSNKTGPIDQFVKLDDPSIALSKNKYQQNIAIIIDQEKAYRLGQYLARWMYKKNIPFNTINDDDFEAFTEVVGRIGPNWKQPSRDIIREKMLVQEVERTKDLLKPHEEARVDFGCSIMTDAWTDKKRRSIMNLCVHCKLGTAFLESKEALADAHTSLYILNYVHECIAKLGEDNVVQVVTDNASNNMGAKALLKHSRPQIFWTSCATHTLNLMVKAIGRLKQFGPTITKSKDMTIFLYAHHKTLSLMRSYTKKRDIVRPGVTRFASAFLTLQSLAAKKKKLRAMVCGDAWEECKHTRTKKGKLSHATIMSRGYWKNVSLCIKVFEPLVKVLWLLIVTVNPWPQSMKEGLFGKVAAIRAIDNADFNVGEWWENYGLQCPTLQKMALRILNLTSSSTGCERNWSTFKMVDAKRRNRLDVRRRDKLVYIQFNGRMMNKRKKLSSSSDVLLSYDATQAQDWICPDAYTEDDEFDPVSGIAYVVLDDAMGATEATNPRRSARVRELHEVDEFLSDGEDESEHEYDMDEEIEYESDDDGVMSTKDNEEEEEPPQP